MTLLVNMAQLHIQIKTEVLDQLKAQLGLSSNVRVLEEALTLLSWAAKEKMDGRMVLSALPDGTKVVRLAMATLMQPTSPRPTRRVS